MTCLLSCRMLFLVLFAKCNNVDLCVVMERYLYLYLSVSKMLKYSVSKTQNNYSLLFFFLQNKHKSLFKQGTCGKSLKW